MFSKMSDVSLQKRIFHSGSLPARCVNKIVHKIMREKQPALQTDGSTTIIIEPTENNEQFFADTVGAWSI